jgi:uncharacterized protein YvpB
MTQLKILVDTVLKQQPVQSPTLPNDQKQDVKAGSVFTIKSFIPASDHLKVVLADKSFQNKTIWYAYQRHVTILGNNGQIAFPTSTKLAVPYYDQLDNSEDPYGTCNVTSMAMVLSYFHAKRQRADMGFPDELNEYCSAHGLDRHEPDDLVKVAQNYGCRDRFSKTATMNEVKEWLLQGNPAIVHGYFTPSGHIICLIGYNATGFVVNDPYGEIMYTPYHSYYATYASGSGLTYSYNLIANTCCTDNEFWVHFISRT